jgi:hypothetical protein
MPVELYSSRIIELHVSVQTALLVQFQEKVIEFHYELKDLYVQNQFVHKVDETV